MSDFDKNIKAWVKRLRPDHKEDGARWYITAHRYCLQLSEETKTPLPSVVGILAALSPQVSWEVNLASTKAILHDGKIDKGYTGYSINVEKALDCLLYPPEDILKGEKVKAFFDNVLRPRHSKAVTIDIHMGRILYDTLNLTSQQASAIFRKTINHDAQEAVRLQAKRLKTRPLELQAALWLCVREMVQRKANVDQLDLYCK